MVIDNGAYHNTVNANAWHVVNSYRTTNVARGASVDSVYNKYPHIEAVTAVDLADGTVYLLVSFAVSIDNHQI